MRQIQKTFFALGTANTVTVFDQELSEERIIKVLDHIKMQTLRFDHMFSAFREDSEIAEINRAAGKKLVTVSKETIDVIEKAVEISKDSQGTFDITSGSVLRIWREAKRENRLPCMEELKRTMDLINYKNIVIDHEKVGLSQIGQELDLGGIAKGYAADVAKQMLLDEGISDGFINFGGSVIAFGSPKQIGIQNPFAKTGVSAGTVIVSNQAVVTSGNYERYFEKDGQRYHHILDPATGFPSTSGLAGVTLIGDLACELDGLSTAVFVMGLKSGMRLLNQYRIEGIFMEGSGATYVTPGLKDKFIMGKKEINYYG
ncbi:FAD:protein FMN transferase [Lacrimispora sp. AGF001]|uniref:FAD:protein FMN transferase n=1 Tax=Lacrimispora sp. AGF001 TaxID=3401631 RepID=UPI003B42ED1C